MPKPPLPHLTRSNDLYKRQAHILLQLFAVAIVIIVLCVGMSIYYFGKRGTIFTLPAAIVLFILIVSLLALYFFGVRKVVAALRAHEAMRNYGMLRKE